MGLNKNQNSGNFNGEVGDMSNYATKSDLSTKVTKETNKSLVDDSLIDKLEGLENYDDSLVKEEINSINTQLTHNTNELKGCVNITNFGAVGNDVIKDTEGLLNAIATNLVVNVPEGVFDINEKITLHPWQKLILNKRTILNFKQLDGTCIELGYQSTLEGGQIKVDVGFTGTVIGYYSNEAYKYKLEYLPFTSNANDVMSSHKAIVRDVVIQKSIVRPRTINDISGIAIELKATNIEANCGFLWGVTLDNVVINGAFDVGVYIHTINESDENSAPWLHDTFINNLIAQYPKKCFVVENVNLVNIKQGAFQPQTTLDEQRYAVSGIDIINSSNISIEGFSMWDTHVFKSGYEYSVYNTYGWCRNITIYDFATPNRQTGKCRVQYDTIDTLLTMKYYTGAGQYIFEELINYKCNNKMSNDIMEHFHHFKSQNNLIDYAIPIFPNVNTSKATKEEPIVAKLGYIELPRNAEEQVYYLTIEEHSTTRMQGYVTIYFSTDGEGIPTVSKRLQVMNNANPDFFADYGFTYEIIDSKTKVILYRVYTDYRHDSYQYQRYLRMRSYTTFITNIQTEIDVPEDLKYVTHKTEGIIGKWGSRPLNVYTGYSCFDVNITPNRPIWCKTPPTFDEAGNTLTPAVWVDAYGDEV